MAGLDAGEGVSLRSVALAGTTARRPWHLGDGHLILERRGLLDLMVSSTGWPGGHFTSSGNVRVGPKIELTGCNSLIGIHVLCVHRRFDKSAHWFHVFLIVMAGVAFALIVPGRAE